LGTKVSSHGFGSGFLDAENKQNSKIMAYKSTDPRRGKKAKENITILSGWRVLAEMKKEKSPCTVMVFEQKDDPWFIHPTKFMTKSGVINETSMVLQPELDRWIQIYEKEGFVVVQRNPITKTK
jgi:hypothetical protein